MELPNANECHWQLTVDDGQMCYRLPTKWPLSSVLCKTSPSYNSQLISCPHRNTCFFLFHAFSIIQMHFCIDVHHQTLTFSLVDIEMDREIKTVKRSRDRCREIEIKRSRGTKIPRRLYEERERERFKVYKSERLTLGSRSRDWNKERKRITFGDQDKPQGTGSGKKWDVFGNTNVRSHKDTCRIYLLHLI